MKLLITGDLAVLQAYNAASQIDDKIKDLFSKSDLNIVNLEAPVTNSNIPILKTGPNLKSHQESAKEVLKTLNIHVATLANNHLTDYGDQGVADTLQFCKEQHVKTVGGGMTIEEASQTLYLDSPEGKIALVNFAENEWNAATPTSAGFNPMDIIDNTKQIHEAKANADYVIVIIHGGHEYYNLPSPRMQKQYRFYAEQGADLIVGHHTHCINGYEIYQGVPIYYSLGNFLFTKNNPNDDWYLGLVLEILIEEKKLSTKLRSVRQDKQGFNLKVNTSDDKKKVFERIKRYNEIIINKVALTKEWEAFSVKKSHSYLNYWSFATFLKNQYLKALLQKLNFNFQNKKTLALFLNLLRCEAHRDLSKEVLTKQIKK